MEQKKKKPILVVVIIAAVVVYELISWLGSSLLERIITNQDEIDFQEKTYEKISYTELTKEQRLEDFDYFYEMIRTTLPYVYEMDEKYGFSVLEKEQGYRRMVAECRNDYEFLALMSSIINDIPSGHATFIPPDYYNYFTSGYYRADTVGINLTENLHGKLDAYAEYLVEQQKILNEKMSGFCAFTYADGTYLCTGTTQNGMIHSTITAINGEAPEKFITAMTSPTGKIQYDPKNEKPYRASVVFSDTGSEPITLSLKLLDGTDCEAELYCDYDLCYSLYYGGYFVEENLSNGEGEVFEAAPDADESSIGIQTDMENDLAYVSLSSLLYSDGSVIKKKLSEISDYHTIVIDIRGNGGGVSTFFEEYIYPALYKDDAKFEATGYVPKNSYTKGLFDGFLGGLLNRWANNLRFGVTDEYPPDMPDCNNGQYYKYTFTHDLYGDSSLTYSDDREVYYIVNNNTCSAADEIAQMVKSCNLGKVVGTHTLGEGLVFGVCCDWLPNSLLMYMYCPTYSVDCDGVNNTLYGTQPDIYGGTTLEGYIRSDDMEFAGEDWQSLAAREEWDNNYRIILAQRGALDAAA